MPKISILLIFSFFIGAIVYADTSLQIYLHTDREIYTVGDDIFYKAYTDDFSELAGDQGLCYINVALIGPDSVVYSTQKIALDQGAGVGDIAVGLNWPSGQYLIRAYMHEANDDAHVFRKSIFIYGLRGTVDPIKDVKVKPELSVRFYPAGGYLVKDLNCRLGVKAEDQFGNGIQIEGWLERAGESTATSFITDSLGYGQFQMIPKDTSAVAVSVIYQEDAIMYQLPKALERGYTCEIVSQDDDDVRVLVQCNTSAGLQGAMLQVRQQDQIILEKTLDIDPGQEVFFGAENLAAGIFCITLVDAANRPVAEVLGFHYDETDEVFLDLTVNHVDDSLDIFLESYNYDGDLLAADLSVSMVDQRYAKVLFASDIRTYFQLESELAGSIVQPGIYFGEDLETARHRMANLLLCEGWRRYKWLAEGSPEAEVQELQNCLAISGRTTLPGNPNKGVHAHGFVSDLSQDFEFIPFQTDAEGYFKIEDVQLTGVRNLFFQAERWKKRKYQKSLDKNKLTGNRQVSIQVFADSTAGLTKADFAYLRRTRPQSGGMDYLSDNSAIISRAQDSWEGWSLTTDTVEVIAEKINPIVDYYEDGMLYTRPNQRIFMDQIQAPNRYRTIFDVIRARVTNATITGLGGVAGLYEETSGPKVIFRGGTSSLSVATQSNTVASFLLNGSMVSASTVESIAPQDIAFIDVIRDLSSLATYGEAGSGGIIAIYLKQGQQIEITKDEKRGTLHLVYQGYHQAREFFETKQPVGTHTRNNSPTLFWHPSIRLQDGSGIIRVPKSQRSGPFVLTVEGVTEDGTPVATRKIFTAR